MKKIVATAFLAACLLGGNADKQIEIQDFEPLPIPPAIEYAGMPVSRRYEESDLRHLSAIIYAEAGNQCLAGQQGVGIVVINRVNCETEFADNIIDVLYEPGQFYPKGSPRFEWALSKYDNGFIPQSCVEAAKYALNGNDYVIYNGQKIDFTDIYYFARNWTYEKFRIQDHDFK